MYTRICEELDASQRSDACWASGESEAVWAWSSLSNIFPGTVLQRKHKKAIPFGVNYSFYWWLHLPDSAALLLASLNCRTFLWILFVISWLILCSKYSCFSKLRHLIWATCLWSKRSYAVIHCQGPKFKVLFGKVAFNKLSCFLTWL